RPFTRRVQKRLQILGEKGDIFAGTIFQNELESAGSAHARNRRRRKREGDPFGKPGELFVNVRLDGGVLFFRLGPFAPRLERDEEKGAISILHETEQTESDNASRVMDARNFAENLFDFARRGIGSLKGCGVRSLQR